MTEIHLRPHGEGVIVPHEATGGVISFVELSMESRHLIRGHVHERNDVWVYVLHGEVGVRVGGDEAVGTPGDYLLKPRGVPHAMWNPGDEPNRLIEILTPGDGDMFFREFATPLFGCVAGGLRSDGGAARHHVLRRLDVRSLRALQPGSIRLGRKALRIV